MRTQETPQGLRYYIGIDLAFSPRNNSGVVVLSGNLGTDGLTYLESRLCKSDEEISEFILPYLVPSHTTVAVDAPLVVPNETGMRSCERLVGKKFGRNGCGAYPAHKGNMAGTRGPNLLLYLAGRGVSVHIGPTMDAGQPYVHFMETYPHASHLALFGLPSVWKYKKKSGRSWGSCRAELVNYWREMLRILPGIEEKMLQVVGTDPLADFLQPWLPSIHKEAVPPDIKGVRYKAFEDLTDGLFCAYVALHLRAGWPGLLFAPQNPGLSNLSRYEPGQDFIVVPSR